MLNFIVIPCPIDSPNFIGGFKVSNVFNGLEVYSSFLYTIKGAPKKLTLYLKFGNSLSVIGSKRLSKKAESKVCFAIELLTSKGLNVPNAAINVGAPDRIKFHIPEDYKHQIECDF